MTSILLAVVLLSATLTANDAGAATDSDVESAQFADRFYWALAMAEEVDTGKPPSTHGPLGFAIRLHIPQRNPGTAASATPNAPMLRKSVADYGALSFVAGTLGSDHCLGSSGAAIDPSGKFVFMSGGIGSPGRLCGFVVDPVTGGWTPVPPGGIPVATGTLPGAVAIDPSGRFVYVPGGSSNGTRHRLCDRSRDGHPDAVARLTLRIRRLVSSPRRH